jgi:hypothetical protein
MSADRIFYSILEVADYDGMDDLVAWMKRKKSLLIPVIERVLAERGRRVPAAAFEPVEEAPVIRSLPLYPNKATGSVALALNAGSQYRNAGPAWPPLHPGQEVWVEDIDGWRWHVRIDDVRDAEHARATVLSPAVALPGPAVAPDGSLALPNRSGHAHLRVWRQGDIVEYEGKTYKVTHKPKTNDYGSMRYYRLAEVSPEMLAKRPARVRMRDEYEAHAAVGSAVQTPEGEWVHIKKTERARYRDEDGNSYVSWFGVGNLVDAEKARRINEVHGPTLARDLALLHGERVHARMPDDAQVLLPKKTGSYAASGERVALVDGAVWHERVGDPDMIDSWHHYVIRIDDPAVVRRVKRFLGKAR